MTRRARALRALLSQRCLCGLKLRHHRDAYNQSLSCQDAADRHRYARVKHRRLRELMLASIDEARR